MRRVRPGLLLLIMIVQPALAQKQLLWGDTHLHSTYSSDAFANQNLVADPDTAYRYATGLPVVHPYHKARVQIDTPLDFLVVSDHAEFLGVIRHIYFNDLDTHGLGVLDGVKAKFAQWYLRRKMDAGEARDLFINVLPLPQDPREGAKSMAEQAGSVGWFPPLPGVEQSTWREITAAADRYNRPGEFTALIGWEWSSLPGGANLHRIVLTDADAALAQQFQPYGTDDSPYPEDLWQWLDRTSERISANFLAIPHNSNISKGMMFDERTLRGAEFSADYLALRTRWETIAEITQIKGDSEAHPQLSPNDPYADFEEYPYYIQRSKTPYQPRRGDYLRSALKRGLELEASQGFGVNPYQLGFIGSTDSHTAMASAEESNFHGKLATDSIPANKQTPWGDNAGAYGWGMSASGLAGVWAEENSRESILAAMRRREVYATTGPRIRLQVFAGWELSAADLDSPDLASTLAGRAVPMGGELTAIGAAAPALILRADRDPATADLERAQVIKGWLDAQGNARERIYDVAVAPAGEPGDVGIAAVAVTATRAAGATQFNVLWQDPDFDASQSAFYYLRVLQVPTPRHSLYDAVALGKENADGSPDMIQERAYSSPIWYRPAATGE